MSSAGVQSWSYSAIDNSTINGIVISENCAAANINNAIRQAMSSVMQEISYQGIDASATASLSLAGVDWRFMAVTGSASIIHVGTGRAGLVRNVIWNSASTLVNSANILCDGSANIVTHTNDMTMFTSLGSGAWRAVHFPVSAQTVNTNDIINGAVTFIKLQPITDGHILGASGGTAIEEISVGAGLQLVSNTLSTTGTGTIVQVVKSETGAVATGSTVIPLDDSIPQITEGDQYMTLAITPTSAANKLRIDVVLFAASSSAFNLMAALFQDATAGALAGGVENFRSNNQIQGVKFTHHMTAGTTSATMFRVRAGDSGASTLTFNGIGGARIFGGVMASSITITEYT